MRTLILILCFFSTTILFGSTKDKLNSRHFHNEYVELVTTYFPNHGLKFTSVYNQELGITTKVKITFNTKTVVEYNKNGKLVLFECYENDFVPNVVLPKRIRKYLEKEYLGINVIKYYADYVKKEYIIVLENDLSITFN